MDVLKTRIEQLEEKKGENPNATVSFHGVMVGNFQAVSSGDTQAPSVNESRGTFVFQPTVRVVPSEHNEFFFKFGFAGGNGLSGVSPFVLSLWDTDTEDSVTDINGQKRSYLLTSWYKRSLSKGPIGVEVTGGIIDASEYVGENTYAGDPLTQFMNEALVSRAHTLTPSYDLGGVVKAEGGPCR